MTDFKVGDRVIVKETKDVGTIVGMRSGQLIALWVEVDSEVKDGMNSAKAN